MNDKLFESSVTSQQLGLLERSAYREITRLIGAGEYDNARKVADILKAVGIV